MKAIYFSRGSVLILVVAAMLACQTVAAQGRWNLAAKLAVDFPTQDYASLDMQTGVGFEGAISYDLLPQIAVVAGWDWHHFNVNNSSISDLETSGYIAGLQLKQAINGSGSAFFAGGAAIYQHIEAETKPANNIIDTGHGWGWQAEAGWILPLNDRLRLVPAVRYRTLSRDINAGEGPVSSSLNTITVSAGLQWSF